MIFYVSDLTISMVSAAALVKRGREHFAELRGGRGSARGHSAVDGAISRPREGG